MILFVREGCDFCKDLPEVDGLKVYKVVETSDGPRVEMNRNTLIDVPHQVKGLPALLDGANLYVGKDLILPRLEELAKK